jgi:fumarate reductase subunit C
MDQTNPIIAGVGLAHTARKSRWPARLDLVQSGTGLVLALFMWGHMFFVSTILLGKDAMWSITRFFEGYFIFGTAFPWFVSVVVAVIWLFFMAHAFLAMRKFPATYRQYRDFVGHRKLLRHADTSLWWVQVLTGFLLFFLVPPHLYQMLVHPGAIGPHGSAARVASDGWAPLYLVLMVPVGLHGVIGLYRLVVKWGWIEGAEPARTRRRLLVLAGALITIYFGVGLLTDETYLRIGRELEGKPVVEHVPSWAQPGAHGEGRP